MNNDYINSYKDYLRIDKKYSDNTVKSYMNDLNKFNTFINKKNILKVQKQDIIDYIEYERKLKKADKTVNHDLIVIRNFYKFLEKTSEIKNNPTSNIELPKTKKVYLEYYLLKMLIIYLISS